MTPIRAADPEDELYDAVRTWLDGMLEYETEALIKKKTGMRVKGGAFIATFPGPDSESTVPRDPTSETSDLAPVLLNTGHSRDAGTPRSTFSTMTCPTVWAPVVVAN
jgi:hypothetical protein